MKREFIPKEPSYDDARAYVRGFFPQTLLGNHVQWAMNYISINEQLEDERYDMYPRHRMYIVDACVQLLGNLEPVITDTMAEELRERVEIKRKELGV